MCNEGDFDNPCPLFGLLVLLNKFEFERLIEKIAARAPIESSLAWQIIRLSDNNKSHWFVDCHAAPFQRQIHLHPAITPLLLKAAIRPSSETQDLIALFEYFEQVANEYSVLREALPLWQAEQERRRHELKAIKEKENAERLIQEARRAARLSELNQIQYSGPDAILRALADAPSSGSWDFPENWAWISDKKLRAISEDLLERALPKISSQTTPRCWSSLSHKILNALNTLRRSAELAKLEHSPLAEKLRFACDSRWSLTYFPESWAEQFLQVKPAIQNELRTHLLSKLMRLQRRTLWRDLKHLLLRQNRTGGAN